MRSFLSKDGIVGLVEPFDGASCSEIVLDVKKGPVNEPIELAQSDFYDEVYKGFFSDDRPRILNGLSKKGREVMAMVEGNGSEYTSLLKEVVADSNMSLGGSINVCKDSVICAIDRLLNAANSEVDFHLERRLSSGVSRRSVPYVLLLQKIFSAMDSSLNSNYSGYQGYQQMLSSVALLEKELFGGVDTYSERGIFFTNGASNGINSIVSFLANDLQGRSIVSCGPVYHQFARNADWNNVGLKVLINENCDSGAQGENTRLLPSVDQVIENSKNAGALVVTLPGVSGEIYSEEELKKLIELAVQEDLLIVEDAVFEELVFPEYKREYVSLGALAAKMGVLDRVVTIKSYSKGLNFPRLRIGMILTDNKKVIDYMAKYLRAQRDFPTGDKGMVCLNSLLRIVEHKVMNGGDLEDCLQETWEQFKVGGLLDSVYVPVTPFMAQSYILQRIQDVICYQDSLKECDDFGIFQARSEIQAGFNGMFLIKGSYSERIKELGMLETSRRLFQTVGIESEWGPGFGISADNGVWIRVTFTGSKDYTNSSLRALEQGLSLL